MSLTLRFDPLPILDEGVCTAGGAIRKLHSFPSQAVQSIVASECHVCKSGRLGYVIGYGRCLGLAEF